MSLISSIADKKNVDKNWLKIIPVIPIFKYTTQYNEIIKVATVFITLYLVWVFTSTAFFKIFKKYEKIVIEKNWEINVPKIRNPLSGDPNKRNEICILNE